MHRDIAKVLVTKEEIEARIRELGKQITEDYKDSQGLLVVGVLKGAVIYYADLVRELNRPVAMDFISASSYGAGTSTSGMVRINKDLDKNPEGKDILIVEDIIDSGVTLFHLKELLMARHPNSLRICCLLDKVPRRKVDLKADYVGFDIPDEFVVGYGLDYNERYRNLNYIGVLKPSVYND